MSTGYQVNSSLYACRSGMGTGLTFSVVRYGLADSRFARSGSSASGLAANDRSFSQWLYSAAQAPLLDPSMRPTCGFATTSGTNFLREGVSHTEGAARPSPCCFRSRRRPLRLGSRVVARA